MLHAPDPWSARVAGQIERLTGALAGRFVISERIGGGQLAEVYRAHDLDANRPVAIKIFVGDQRGDDAERFLREIEAATVLDHPGIVPVIDSGLADGTLYYTMPFMNDGSLRARMGNGPLSLDDSVSVIEDILAALDASHARGIVHRDIKPDNVLMSNGRASLTDFGIAKLMRSRSARRISINGVPLGTPAYIAPEQVLSRGPIDHRADIYAVGAVAYELLTGNVVFPKSSINAVLNAHLYANPDPIRKRDRRIPKGLARVVMKCLRKDPRDRWASAARLRAALGGVRRTARWTRKFTEFLETVRRSSQGGPVMRLDS